MKLSATAQLALLGAAAQPHALAAHHAGGGHRGGRGADDAVARRRAPPPTSANAISGMGSNMLMIVPGSPRARQGMGASLGVPLFTPADVEALRRGAHDAHPVERQQQPQPAHWWRAATTATAPSSASRPSYFEMRTWAVAEGRVFTPDDERQAAPVCVLGKTVADALFPGENPIGKRAAGARRALPGGGRARRRRAPRPSAWTRTTSCYLPLHHLLRGASSAATACR